METRIRTQTTVTVTLLCALLTLLAGGCAHGTRAKTQPQPLQGEMYGPAAPYGPPTPPQPPQYGPTFPVSRPIVLVLGPGLARGYAYAGVIHALVKSKIKIGAVIGNEMGALIGALYAMDGNVNHLDWGLQWFRGAVFEHNPSLISEFLDHGPAERLDHSLRRVFGRRELSRTAIPLKIQVQQAGFGVKLVDDGLLRVIVRAALGNADGFPPIRLNGVPTGSAASVRAFDIDDAKALGIGPVIAVDVLEAKDSDLFPELKDADFILRPKLNGIAPTDFSRRTDAIFAGKTAALQHMDEIKKLTEGGSS